MVMKYPQFKGEFKSQRVAQSSQSQFSNIGKVDQEKGNYFCFKCWKDFPIHQKGEHLLTHGINEDNQRSLNSTESKSKQSKVYDANYFNDDCFLSNQEIQNLNSSVQKKRTTSSLAEPKSNVLANPFAKKYPSLNKDVSSKKSDPINPYSKIEAINKMYGTGINNNHTFTNFRPSNQKQNNKAKYFDSNVGLAHPIDSYDAYPNPYAPKQFQSKKASNPKVQDLGNIVDMLEGRLVDNVKSNNDSNSNNDMNSNKEGVKEETEEEKMNKRIDMLAEAVIESLEKFTPDTIECSICLIDYKLQDKCIYLPCIHYFHSKCIRDWLKKRAGCPVCLHNPFS